MPEPRRAEVAPNVKAARRLTVAPAPEKTTIAEPMPAIMGRWSWIHGRNAQRPPEHTELNKHH